MTDTFLIKLTQTEKTGSMIQLFIPLGNLTINSTFKNRSRSFFRAISTFVFGECYLHNFQQMNLISIELKRAFMTKCIYQCTNTQGISKYYCNIIAFRIFWQLNIVFFFTFTI